MSKDSTEFIESLKNKSSKSHKSNPEEKGFVVIVILGIMVQADSLCSLSRLIFSYLINKHLIILS
jgi:hypothetical protein